MERVKLTILEAILLTLYGKTSPAVRKAGQPYQAYIDSYMHTNYKNRSLDRTSFRGTGR